METERPKLQAIGRGFLNRCPHCGQGRILHRYLKIVPACPACGEAFGHIRADDAPAWLTILIVGHILVPIVVHVVRTTDIATWIQMILWPAVALAMTLVLLPRAKGMVVGLMWAMRAEGAEE
jgi:uncharacterized protein (DUF983 family)